jgi:transcriptional regulator with XRE-family HTH domain
MAVAEARAVSASDGRPLRTRRVEAGWTQKELGEAAGCDSRTISRIELGSLRPSAGLMDRINQALARQAGRTGQG